MFARGDVVPRHARHIAAVENMPCMWHTLRIPRETDAQPYAPLSETFFIIEWLLAYGSVLILCRGTRRKQRSRVSITPRPRYTPSEILRKPA